MSLTKFRTYLEARGRSESTITRYMQAAKVFTAFTGKTSGFTAGDVQRFLASKESGTYKRFLHYFLKSYCRALGLELTLGKEDLPSLDAPKRPYYNLEETMKILNTVDEHGSLRDRSIVHVAAITGARRKEFRIMDREDYREGRIYIKTAKKGLPRWRALDYQARSILEEYLASRSDDDPAMFRGVRGRLTLTQLSRLMKQILEKAGVYKPRTGYHSFRRGLVTILHKRGLSEREIQDYGGWKSPFMVHTYIQLSPGEVEAKVKAVHPFFKGDELEVNADD